MSQLLRVLKMATTSTKKNTNAKISTPVKLLSKKGKETTRNTCYTCSQL